MCNKYCILYIIVLLGYKLDTIKFTLLKSTVPYFLLYSQFCIHLYYVILEHIITPPKRTLIADIPHVPTPCS